MTNNNISPTRFVTDRQIYDEVLQAHVPNARRFLWLATSDLKDLHVQKGGRMVPFLESISDLVKNGIAVRLLHAKEPGPLFRRDFDRYPALIEGLERLLCPRVHFKCVVVDGVIAYSGSANLTGAGMGAKSVTRRNFESGIVTNDKTLIASIMDQFDKVWMGTYCGDCDRSEFCPDRPEMVE